MVLELNILLTPNKQTTFCLTMLIHMTLQIITLTSSYNVVGLFNLRQKVYISCTYTHFDINKIYKSKKAG